MHSAFPIQLDEIELFIAADSKNSFAAIHWSTRGSSSSRKENPSDGESLDDFDWISSWNLVFSEHCGQKLIRSPSNNRSECADRTRLWSDPRPGKSGGEGWSEWAEGSVWRGPSAQTPGEATTSRAGTARTDASQAGTTADWQRWSGLDRIYISPNPNLKGS